MPRNDPDGATATAVGIEGPARGAEDSREGRTGRPAVRRATRPVSAFLVAAALAGSTVGIGIDDVAAQVPDGGPSPTLTPTVAVDSDGDGVPDPDDACDGFGSTMTPVALGCDLGELLWHHGLGLTPLRDLAASAEATIGLGDLPELEQFLPALRFIDDHGLRGDRFLRLGRPCAAVASMTDSIDAAAVEDAETAVAQRIRAEAADTRPQGVPADPDHFGESDDDLDEILADLARTVHTLGEIDELDQSIRDGVSRVCDGLGPSTRRRAVIESIDGPEGEVRLEGVRGTFLLPPDSSIVAAAGHRIDVTTQQVEPGIHLITGGRTITPVAELQVGLGPLGDPATALLAPITGPCVELRVVPAQPAISTDATIAALEPLVDHPVTGYRDASGVHIVDGLAAVTVRRLAGTPGCSPPAGLVTHRMEVTVTGSGYATTATLASGEVLHLHHVDPGDPFRVDTQAVSTACVTGVTGLQCAALRQAATRRQFSKLLLSTPDSYRPPGRFLPGLGDPPGPPKGSTDPMVPRCVVGYSTEEFGFRDGDSAASGTTRITSVAAKNVGDSAFGPALVQAVGYTSPALSASPSRLVPAGATHPLFVVHETRRFHPGVDTSQKYQYVSSLTRFGVPRASGLAWPRRSLVRNGALATWACEPPVVQRDLMGTGFTGEQSFHRLPWALPTTDAIIQGWGGTFSHSNCHCADTMGGTEGVPIFATRGGKVEVAIDFHADNDHPSVTNSFDGSPPNELGIRHEDGTLTNYKHMARDGVVPEVGDIVRRGDLVAYIGNTGYSTGPHLHLWSKEPGADARTYGALYYGLDPNTFAVRPAEPLQTGTELQAAVPF